MAVSKPVKNTTDREREMTLETNVYQVVSFAILGYVGAFDHRQTTTASNIKMSKAYCWNIQSQ